MSENNIEKAKLLLKLQTCDFAAFESALFLDTHKTCKEALEYNAKHKAHAAQYRKEYTEKYGPLSIKDTSNPDTWEWVNSSWPWEYSAN